MPTRAVALLTLVCAALAQEACDVTDTSALWFSQQISLPGCTEDFHDEDALLEHSCAAGDATAAEEMHQIVCACMRRRWWRAARLLLPRVAASASMKVRQFAQHQRDGASEAVTMLLRGSSAGIRHDAVTSAVPAVQWAQSRSTVHLLVRFTTKRHGPVAVANVDDEKVELSPQMVSFDARGRGKPLIFELRLPLEHKVLPEASSWSFEGRGQLTLALAKEENATWKQLCPAAVEGERRGSVSTWFEMQESIDKEEKKEKKQAEKKKDAEKKPKEEKKAEAKGAESGAAKGKKAKGAKRPAPGDGWLAWLQWQYAQARQAVVKAWRRFVKWVRGLSGL